MWKWKSTCRLRAPDCMTLWIPWPVRIPCKVWIARAKVCTSKYHLYLHVVNHINILPTMIIIDLDDPDQSASLSSAEVDINSLSSSVTFIVRALQEIIVDVYWLFFKPESDHADNGQNHSANSATKSPSKLRGLVNLTHYQLMKPILDPIARVAKNARFDYSDLLPDVAAYLLTEQLQKSRPPPTAPSSTELGRHKRFLAWFKSVLVTLTDRTNAILSAIQSATEVAQLQQRIWHSCKFITDETYPSSGSKPTAIDNAGDYSQLMWEQSCQFLFSDG